MYIPAHWSEFSKKENRHYQYPGNKSENERINLDIQFKRDYGFLLRFENSIYNQFYYKI